MSNFANADATLTGSAATLITCPANSQIVILKGSVYNSDTIAHSATIYRVANGGTAALAGQITGTGTTIASKGTVILPLSGVTLANQQILQGLADTTSVVSVSLSYIQVP